MAMISNINGYSTSLYSSYSSRASQQEDMKEPPIDTSGDGAWDLEELESFSTEMSEKMGVSFSSEEIMATYDADGNGTITDSEKLAIRDNNGFNMPSIQDIQSSMMNAMGPSPQMMKMQEPPIDTSGDGAWDLEELESFSEELSEQFGVSFDAEEIMSTYDSDEDGTITESEKLAIRDNNGFNMPSIEESEDSESSNMNGKMGPPPPKMMGMQGTTNSDSSVSSLLESLDTEEDEEEDVLSLLESGSTYSQDIIDKYDVNGNGKIDASEEAAIRKDQEKEILEKLSTMKALKAYDNSQYYQNSLNFKSFFDSAVV